MSGFGGGGGGRLTSVSVSLTFLAWLVWFLSQSDLNGCSSVHLCSNIDGKQTLPTSCLECTSTCMLACVHILHDLHSPICRCALFSFLGRLQKSIEYKCECIHVCVSVYMCVCMWGGGGGDMCILCAHVWYVQICISVCMCFACVSWGCRW